MVEMVKRMMEEKKPSTPETAPDNPSPGAPPPDLRPHPDASQPASYDANIQDSFEQKALAAMDQQQKDQLQKQQEAMAKQVAEARAKGQDTLAQVYEERANKARQLAELEAQKAYAENPANNVDAATKERVLAQHALAKAENDILRANNNERQKEIDDLASEIDKMKAKRNHDIRTLLKEQKLQDLKNDLVVDSLSKLSEQDLAILTKLLQQDVYKDTPWAKEIQRLKSQDATDLKKKLEAESALREINKKLLKKKDATLKSPEQKMDDWAGEIDQAILLGEGPSQDVVDFYLRGNPNKIDPSKLEEKNGADAMVRRIVELKQKLHDQAWERLLIDKPELAKALLPVYDPGAKKDDINDAYKRNQKRMKERAEDAKEAKKSDKEKFGRINKLSLNNAVNQLRYAIRNALRGPKEGRAAARKDAINLLFYIGRRVARKTLLFLLLANAAFFLVGPIWVAKKLNDWTGGR